MIYIITGMAKTGKSIVAKKMARKHQLEIISTDYIMVMLDRGNPDLGIHMEESDRSVSKRLEPYLEQLIIALIQNQENYIIEGVHFLPQFIKRMIKKYPHDLSAIFLGYANWKATDKAIDLKKYRTETKNCWYCEYDDQELLKLSKYLVNESVILKEEVNQLGLKYFEIKNIIKDQDEIIDLLVKK